MPHPLQCRSWPGTSLPSCLRPAAGRMTIWASHLKRSQHLPRTTTPLVSSRRPWQPRQRRRPRHPLHPPLSCHPHRCCGCQKCGRQRWWGRASRARGCAARCSGSQSSCQPQCLPSPSASACQVLCHTARGAQGAARPHGPRWAARTRTPPCDPSHGQHPLRHQCLARVWSQAHLALWLMSCPQRLSWPQCCSGTRSPQCRRPCLCPSRSSWACRSSQQVPTRCRQPCCWGCSCSLRPSLTEHAWKAWRSSLWCLPCLSFHHGHHRLARAWMARTARSHGSRGRVRRGAAGATRRVHSVLFSWCLLARQRPRQH
mmetsp:Transcript_9238/g.22874  ORF Transcript_9238/g.22874 Transcript_9238/m.22874 type:complete len:314 (+) Transcript_9238:833-1774(+)